MKQILYSAVLIHCLSVSYTFAQPPYNTQINLTSNAVSTGSAHPCIYDSTIEYKQKKHCDGWYVGENMMAGGLALALAGGVMIYDNRNIITYNEQPADYIIGAGAIIFAIGAEIFRFSFKSEKGWPQRFVLHSDKNSFGIAYKF